MPAAGYHARAAAFSGVAGLVLAISGACGGGPGEAAREAAKLPADKVVAAAEPVDDDALAERYLRAKQALEGGKLIDANTGKELERGLEEIANLARDPHLRANASLLLGSILEGRGERARAVAFYRHATNLVDDDAGPRMALALALAAEGKHAEAAEVQRRVVELDPDNLENWLALGEMLVKSGDEDGATEAYAGYELRRKGLLDGLTLKKDGAYQVDPKGRAACALALAAASDNGTALALLYALQSEPESSVREAIARTMGIQRLRGYTEPLTKHLKTEKDPAVREAVTWALGEVERDPIDTRPSPLEGREPTKAAKRDEPRAPADGGDTSDKSPKQ